VTIKPYSAAALSLILAFGLCAASLAERHALLVGVGQYQSPRISALEGPKNDVAALQNVLRERWGFAPQNIRTLVDGQATRTNILGALDRLSSETKAGEHVFIYLSGHGTSARDRHTQFPLPDTSGAFLPVDFPGSGTLEQQIENLIVGRRDLRPLLKQLDKDRKLFVAIDSCYSGNAVRGLYRSALPTQRFQPRYAALHTRAASALADPDLCGYRCGTRQDEPYPYQNVFFLSAASDDETALDLPHSALTAKPQGAFTNALLHVLSGHRNADGNHDGTISYGELHQAVKVFMESERYPHTPQMLPKLNDDANTLAARALFEQPHSPPSNDVDSKLNDALTIHIASASMPQSRYTELVSALKSLPGIALVKDQPEVTISTQGRDLLLISGAGDLIARLENPGLQELVRRVQRQRWIKQWLQTPINEAKFNISLALTDGTRGITVVEGEMVAFAVQAEQPAYLLLLHIDSLATVVNVLYPYTPQELEPLPADRSLQIPESDLIVVTPPFGTDQLVLYGFDQLPAILRKLMGQTVPLDSPLLKELKTQLASSENSVARVSFKLISVPRQLGSN
jgi:hypothetical protein